MTNAAESRMATSTPASADVKPRRRRILKPLVILLTTALALLGIGGYIGASQGIGEHPEWRKMVRTPADYDLSSEVVSFSSLDGIPLKAWWLPAQPAIAGAAQTAPTSAQAQPTPHAAPALNVVMAHGRDMNRSGMLARAAFLVRHGYNVLDVDLRDHGESGGNYSTPGSRESLDIMGGVAYLLTR